MYSIISLLKHKPSFFQEHNPGPEPLAMEELDTVLLLRDAKDRGLEHDHIGDVVHRYAGGKGTHEVEFAMEESKTVAVLTLSCDNIRPMDQREILHAREFVA